ncbi:hypothetical protein [Dyadobacter frigoris]|uniref:Uncharacterized protein n=1 Tax=Dyadobacter frigoris TaxID=2576211 RepID=A0A4U6CWG3_9BACT|nr:hypothetical protein [Dyadobacter frigoris]TKT87981.1 hypothetical protein FDK13_28170 [Dyadobacter frigoris]
MKAQHNAVGDLLNLKAQLNAVLDADTSSQKISSADMGYNPLLRTVFVPTLTHNTIKAYFIK